MKGDDEMFDEIFLVKYHILLDLLNLQVITKVLLSSVCAWCHGFAALPPWMLETLTPS